ncbi:hypothetical protein [Halobellus ordinarius]|nr:hypothetical protein [Halobellus sp. ZY16]
MELPETPTEPGPDGSVPMSHQTEDDRSTPDRELFGPTTVRGAGE